MSDIRDKKVIVYDRAGLYVYWAQALGRDFGKVYYFIPDADAYPESCKDSIGRGLPEIERINDKQYYKLIDKVDLIAFPDCYDGAYQDWLRRKDYCVFGSGLGEQLEIDKVLFLETLSEVGLLVAKTYLAEGVDDLLQYLDGKTEKWLKSLWRGDFETRKYDNMKQFKNWMYQCLLPKLGQKYKDIEILVQDKINSVAEIGYDGFCVDGQFSSNAFAGIEIKDKGFLTTSFLETPKIIDEPNQKLSEAIKKLGYRGGYSSELRITEKGKPYYIDFTARIGSPPGELMVEFYNNYSQCVWDTANGIVPKPTNKYKYGAELILTSPWYNDHELCVEFPKEIYDNVKLKNHTKRDGCYYCIPNGNGEFFGAVVATGNSIKEVTAKVVDIAKEITCSELDFNPEIFNDAQKQIDAVKQFGINY